MELISENAKSGNARVPTIGEIAERCGLHRCTVTEHMRFLKFDPLETPARLLTDEVLIGMARAGMKGNSGAAKLFMQIVHGWTERTEVRNVDLSKLTDEQLERLADGEPIESILASTGRVGEAPPSPDGEAGEDADDSSLATSS